MYNDFACILHVKQLYNFCSIPTSPVWENEQNSDLISGIDGLTFFTWTWSWAAGLFFAERPLRDSSDVSLEADDIKEEIKTSKLDTYTPCIPYTL